MITAFTSPENWADDEAEKSAPFLCMRLMCSQDPAEIETVKNELSKAGIVTEARKHPLAESLGVNGIELWVPQERDFFNAARLYARMQNRAAREYGSPAANLATEVPPSEADAEVPAAAKAERPFLGGNGSDAETAGGPYGEELEQASSLLEKEIEEVLGRESELVVECASLRGKVKDLSEALAEGQAVLAREIESRAATEHEQAEKLSDLQRALWQEREEWQQQLKSREESLNEMQKKLDSKSQQLHSQQTATMELRKHLVALEQQREEHEKLLSEARVEAAKERELRLAAEEQAAKAAEVQESLERQLLGQKHLAQTMQAHVASIHSLCDRLQAKRVGIPQT